MAVYIAQEEALIGLGTEIFIDHWTLALLAAGAGGAIALACLAADYLLVPALRLRAARRRGPEAVARLMDRERRRLSRLWDQAAVHEEHDHSDSAALREEAELRSFVVEIMARACGHR